MGNCFNGRGGIGSLRSPSSLALLARFEPAPGRHVHTASWETALTDGVGLGRFAPRARSLCSLGSNPRRAGMFILPRGETALTDGVGFEPTRQGCCPHALQACALVRSATRPEASGRRPEVGRRRGWDWVAAARLPELAPFGRSVRTHETLSSRLRLPLKAEGVSASPALRHDPRQSRNVY